MDETGVQAAMDRAVAIAEILKYQSIDHEEIYYEFKERVGNLWAEVCWSACLNEKMKARDFLEAMIHGCKEWDV